MYVGSTGSAGWHHMFYQAIGDIQANAMNGFCSRLEVHVDGSACRVRDDGPLLKEISDLQRDMRKAISTADFEALRGRASHAISRTHWPVIRALSSYSHFAVERDKQRYELSFNMFNEKDEGLWHLGAGEEQAAEIQFIPDFDHLGEAESTQVWDKKRIEDRIRLTTALTNGLVSKLCWNGETQIFNMPNGASDLLRFYQMDAEILSHKSGNVDDLSYEVVVAKSAAPQYFSYVNAVETHEHGSHLDATIRAYENLGFPLDDLSILVSIFHPFPTFAAPQKECLNNADIEETL